MTQKKKKLMSLHTSLQKASVLTSAVLLASLAAGAPSGHVAAGPPGPARADAGQLLVHAPAEVELGQPLQIDLELSGATDAAGMEVAVQYDTAHAEFAGALFGDTSARTQVSQDLAHGVSVLVTTCTLTGCPTGSAADAVHHVSLRIEPQTTGRFTVAVGALQVVTADGSRIAVDVPAASVDVTVTGDAAPGTFAAPAAPFALPAAAGTPMDPAAFDQNANGAVNADDLSNLLADWDAARRTGSCGDPAALAAEDLDGDGCLDVADVQRLAGAGPDTTSTQRAPGNETVGPTGPWVVNTDNDLPDTKVGDGVCKTADNNCSLRAAIYEANAAFGADQINFAIPGDGVHTIQLLAALPIINDSTGGLTINGFTQPGAHPNTDPLVSNAAIMVEIKGQGPMISYDPPTPNFSAFRITSARNVIQGLSIYDVFDHIEISGANAVGNLVIGNLIGTNVAATYDARDLQEGGSGVKIHSGATNNIVGRPNAGDRNVISGTPSTGVRIEHDGTDHNVVQNNIFGLVPAGNAARPNGFSGVDMQFGASYNIVGGTGPMEHNLIDGTFYTGVDLSHGEFTTQNQVVGNLIGTTPDGNSIAPYTQPRQFGVSFKDGVLDNLVFGNVIGGAKSYAIYNKQDYTGRNYIFNNRIGVSANGSPLPNDSWGMYLQGHDFQVGPGNIFANNALGGVYVTSSITVNNRISANSFIGNGGLAIDLAPAGPTPNDAGDADTGPNTLLNYPLVNPANTTQSSGTACAGCRVEVYRASVDTGNRGEGNLYVADTTAGADGTWNATMSGLVVGDKIAAIAIDAKGNTSEFSPVASVTTVGPDLTPPPTTPPATPPTTPPPGDVGSEAPAPGTYAPLVPARLLDTRPGFATVDGQFAGTGLVGAGSTVELVVAGRGGVPLGVATAVLDVTATEAAGPGFVTVYPCGLDRPLASNLNVSPGQNVANSVIVPIGQDGKVCLFSQQPTHLVVDVDGYFPDNAAFASLVPARLLDTRAGATTADGLQAAGGAVGADSITELAVAGRGGVPATAVAAALNVTATESTGPGFITVFPCGEARPLASSLNVVAGQNVANATLSRIGQDGKICIYSQVATHLVVDVNGYAPPGSTYQALTPARLLDTRAGLATVDGRFAGAGLVPADSVVQLDVTGRGGVAASARAVVLDLTATEAAGPGFVTVYPCDAPRPLASNLNVLPGRNIANLVVTGLSPTGTVCLYTQQATHLVVDVQGAFS